MGALDGLLVLSLEQAVANNAGLLVQVQQRLSQPANQNRGVPGGGVIEMINNVFASKPPNPQLLG